ncbi:MAG TPA: hypothetical protein DHW34_07075 [Actinobacteria bacterium]|nr:hypothetical protein [Actinomycetota bacterium]
MSRGGQCYAVARQEVSVEQTSTAAKVWPQVFLHIGKNHEVPLQALGPMSRHHAHGFARDTAIGKRVRRKFLLPQLVKKGCYSARRTTLCLTSSECEQSHDGIKISICATTTGATPKDSILQFVCPTRRTTIALRLLLPQAPQHLVRRSTAIHDRSSEQDQFPELLSPPSSRPIEFIGKSWIAHNAMDQFV